MNKDKLKEVAGELEKASKMHAGQAKKIKSMLKYKKSSGFKMYGKSPLMKKLIGKQHNLPEELKAKIEASPIQKRGLWDNIHAKRKRIKEGSGEKMRKPGDKGAPSAKDLRDSQ